MFTKDKKMSKYLLEIALQSGMVAKIVDDRIMITIDSEVTKRDLWDAQIEIWLSKKDDIKTLSSGFFRLIKNKLLFKKWQ